MSQWIVYKHTNKINNKIYIGITSRTLEIRWANGKGYINNPRFTNAINKYGVENFSHEILYKCDTKEEACAKEIELIAQYNSTNPDIGYNISLGGTAPMYERTHTEETKRKYSQQRQGANNSFYGKKHTEETKEKIRQANIGRKHTEEWKQKQSVRSKKWHQTHENPMKNDHRFAGENNPMYGIRGADNPNSKAVEQYSLEGEYIQTFSSITEALQAIAPNVKSSHIGDCCNGKRKVWHGYKWKWANT